MPELLLLLMPPIFYPSMSLWVSLHLVLSVYIIWFFLPANICLLDVVSIIQRKQTLSSFFTVFTAHSMGLSVLNKGPDSKNEY